VAGIALVDIVLFWFSALEESFFVLKKECFCFFVAFLADAFEEAFDTFIVFAVVGFGEAFDTLVVFAVVGFGEDGLFIDGDECVTGAEDFAGLRLSEFPEECEEGERFALDGFPPRETGPCLRLVGLDFP